eukprot:2156712-Lingulodinium_polyedra.AAC.1
MARPPPRKGRGNVRAVRRAPRPRGKLCERAAKGCGLRATKTFEMHARARHARIARKNGRHPT